MRVSQIRQVRSAEPNGWQKITSENQSHYPIIATLHPWLVQYRWEMWFHKRQQRIVINRLLVPRFSSLEMDHSFSVGKKITCATIYFQHDVAAWENNNCIFLSARAMRSSTVLGVVRSCRNWMESKNPRSRVFVSELLFDELDTRPSLVHAAFTFPGNCR